MATRKPAAAKSAPHLERDPRDDIIARLQHQLESMETRFVALESASGGMELLPPEEVPVFEIGPGGYYSPDDVLYPEGVQIEDITGRMPLNEQLIPLNRPAEMRLERYLRTLPQHGTPNHEFVLEAAFRQLATLQGMGDTPEARSAFGERVLEEAGKLKMKQLGLLPGNDMPRGGAPRPAHRAGNVPIMPNTRIRSDASPLGHIIPDRVPMRGAPQTRVRAGATSPGSKAAPPMGTVASTNLGTAGPGARAA